MYEYRFSIGHALMSSLDNFFVRNASVFLELGVSTNLSVLPIERQGYIAGVYTGLVERMPPREKNSYKSRIRELVGDSNFQWLEQHLRETKREEPQSCIKLDRLLHP